MTQFYDRKYAAERAAHNDDDDVSKEPIYTYDFVQLLSSYAIYQQCGVVLGRVHSSTIIDTTNTTNSRERQHRRHSSRNRAIRNEGKKITSDDS